MVSKTINVGAKVDIRDFDPLKNVTETDREPRIYKSQVYEVLDNGEIEMLMPMEKGRLLLLSLGLRYEFVFYTQTGLYQAIGEVKERYKSDNRYMIRVAMHTPLSKFQRRQFFRLQCLVDVTYYCISEEQAEYEKVEDIMDEIKEEQPQVISNKGTVVDISGGGIRFVSAEAIPENSYILISMTLDDGQGEKTHTLVGRIVHSALQQNRDVVDAKYENRVEYVLKDTKVQESIIKYIFAEERKSRNVDNR